jgi:hypothetical protein
MLRGAIELELSRLVTLCIAPKQSWQSIRASAGLLYTSWKALRLSVRVDEGDILRRRATYGTSILNTAGGQLYGRPA